MTPALRFRRRPGARPLAAVLLLSGLLAASASAQVAVGDGTLWGHVGVGGRAYSDRPSDPASGKFAEYRDVSSGFYVPVADLEYASGDERTIVEFGGLRAGREDQRFWLHGYQPGVVDVQVGWDQTPHVFSTTGRLLTPESAPGVFPLPAPRPQLPAHNDAPRVDEIDLRWDTGRAAVRVTPTPEWDLQADYRRIDKDGHRPIGMAFGSPGNNFREVLEPIDQTVHDLRLSQGYASERFQVQLAYNLSLFQNDLDAVVAANPSVEVDTPTAGSSQGRTALAPGNVAHTFSLVGGLNLPGASRLAGTLAYGIRRQDERFLPFTINTAIAAPDTAPGLLTLPRDRLGGDVQTLLFNVTGSTRPLAATTLTARYRFYDFDDRTEDFTIPARVLNDRSIQVGEHDRHAYDFQRHNASVDLRWHPVRVATLRVGWGYERWARNEDLREVEATNEHTPRLTLDVTPLDWLLLRGSYAHSWRDGTAYERVVDAQLAELRKFDQGTREGDRADLLAQVLPIDQVAFTATLAAADHDYTDSPYGLRENRNWAAGADVTWTPHPRIGLFASYMREEFDLDQRSRYREPDQLDNLTFDWVGRQEDEIDTIGLGFDASVVPDRLEAGARWDYSFARWRLLAENPVPPEGGTENQRAAATAVDFPEFTNQYRPFEAYLRYRSPARWTATLGYTYERFTESDFRTDDLLPATGADLFLGNDFLNYEAGYFTFIVGYDLGGAPVAELPE